jgi:hypothetical protein
MYFEKYIKYKAKFKKLEEGVVKTFLENNLPDNFNTIDVRVFLHKIKGDQTALIKAIDSGEFEVANGIINYIDKLDNEDKMKAINATNSKGHVALQFAIKKKKEDIYNKLLDMNASITFLAFNAALATDVEISNLLLTKGANINMKDGDGNTHLHIAAKNNVLNIVEYLLSKGIDTTLTNVNGITALTLAEESKDSDTETNASIISAIKRHDASKQPAASLARQ